MSTKEGPPPQQQQIISLISSVTGAYESNLFQPEGSFLKAIPVEGQDIRRLVRQTSILSIFSVHRDRGTEDVQEKKEEIPGLSYLASVSKILFSFFVEDYFRNPDLLFVNITIDELLNLIKDILYRIRDNNQYLRDFISSLNSLNPGLAFPIPTDSDSLSSLSTDGVSDDLSHNKYFRQFQDYIKQMPTTNININIKVSYLIELSLTYSSNYATSILRKFILDDLKKDRSGEDQGQEQIDDRSILLNAYTKHYGQYGLSQDSYVPGGPGGLDVFRIPFFNCGDMGVFARIMHAYVADDNKRSSSFALASMKNNTTDFGHDFTNSELGRELLNRGYTIYEKTGYYQLVNWVPGLGEFKPPHMLINTVFSVVDPQGNIVGTFAFSMEVPIDTRNAPTFEKEFDDNGRTIVIKNHPFTDDAIPVLGEQVENYYNDIKVAASQYFRELVIQNIQHLFT